MATKQQTVAQKLATLELPSPPKPMGLYKPLARIGNLVYVSGHRPLQLGGSPMEGRVGASLDLKGGYDGSRQVGLTMLATLQANCTPEELERMRVIWFLSMTNAAVGFGEHAKVTNGFAELFAQIWGDERGVGAFCDAGMGTLPDNIPSEAEAIFHLPDALPVQLAAPAGGVAQKLTTLTLPPPPKPIGLYKPFVRVGDMIYLSGHGPMLPDGSLMVGRVGGDLDLKGGYDAARQVGLTMLAILQANFAPEELERMRIIKVLGMVNAADGFLAHPKCINGCSELFQEVWGQERGVGARSAVGMSTLPGNIPVEVEAIVHLPDVSTDSAGALPPPCPRQQLVVLQKLDTLTFPAPPGPSGLCKQVTRVGDMVYVSGHQPVLSDGSLMVGRVGAEFDMKGGYDAARQAGLTMFATLRANFSAAELQRMRVIKLLGMVNAVDGFLVHPKVINGCSELFSEVWGHERGVGARSAVGMATLQDDVPVVVDGIFHLLAADGDGSNAPPQKRARGGESEAPIP